MLKSLFTICFSIILTFSASASINDPLEYCVENNLTYAMLGTEVSYIQSFKGEALVNVPRFDSFTEEGKEKLHSYIPVSIKTDINDVFDNMPPLLQDKVIELKDSETPIDFALSMQSFPWEREENISFYAHPWMARPKKLNSGRELLNANILEGKSLEEIKSYGTVIFFNLKERTINPSRGSMFVGKCEDLINRPLWSITTASPEHAYMRSIITLHLPLHPNQALALQEVFVDDPQNLSTLYGMLSENDAFLGAPIFEALKALVPMNRIERVAPIKKVKRIKRIVIPTGRLTPLVFDADGAPQPVAFKEKTYKTKNKGDVTLLLTPNGIHTSKAFIECDINENTGELSAPFYFIAGQEYPVDLLNPRGKRLYFQECLDEHELPLFNKRSDIENPPLPALKLLTDIEAGPEEWQEALPFFSRSTYTKSDLDQKQYSRSYSMRYNLAAIDQLKIETLGYNAIYNERGRLTDKQDQSALGSFAENLEKILGEKSPSRHTFDYLSNLMIKGKAEVPGRFRGENDFYNAGRNPFEGTSQEENLAFYLAEHRKMQKSRLKKERQDQYHQNEVFLETLNRYNAPKKEIKAVRTLMRILKQKVPNRIVEQQARDADILSHFYNITSGETHKVVILLQNFLGMHGDKFSDSKEVRTILKNIQGYIDLQVNLENLVQNLFGDVILNQEGGVDFARFDNQGVMENTIEE
ncbi:MAG: hypothetical protein GY915_07010 [bacterium]|nr:hypothetical protein [bacterium]